METRVLDRPVEPLLALGRIVPVAQAREDDRALEVGLHEPEMGLPHLVHVEWEAGLLEVGEGTVHRRSVRDWRVHEMTRRAQLDRVLACAPQVLAPESACVAQGVDKRV